MNLQVVFMVGDIELAPAIQLLDIGLVIVEQVPLSLAGKLQRSRGIGLLQNHRCLETGNGRVY